MAVATWRMFAVTRSDSKFFFTQHVATNGMPFAVVTYASVCGAYVFLFLSVHPHQRNRFVTPHTRTAVNSNTQTSSCVQELTQGRNAATPHGIHCGVCFYMCMLIFFGCRLIIIVLFKNILGFFMSFCKKGVSWQSLLCCRSSKRFSLFPRIVAGFNAEIRPSTRSTAHKYTHTYTHTHSRHAVPDR